MLLDHALLPADLGELPLVVAEGERSRLGALRDLKKRLEGDDDDKT